MRFKAWFINELGYHFSKVFETSDEMTDFINSASEVGTILLGFTSIA